MLKLAKDKVLNFNLNARPSPHGFQSMWSPALPTCQPPLPALTLVPAASATLLLEKPWEHSQQTLPQGEASVFPALLAPPAHPTPAHPARSLRSAPVEHCLLVPLFAASMSLPI